MITEYWQIITDPAHGLAEFTYALVIDILVFGFIWTKILKPRLKREVHKELDAEHGYVDHRKVRDDG